MLHEKVRKRCPMVHVNSIMSPKTMSNLLVKSTTEILDRIKSYPQNPNGSPKTVSKLSKTVSKWHPGVTKGALGLPRRPRRGHLEPTGDQRGVQETPDVPQRVPRSAKLIQESSKGDPREHHEGSKGALGAPKWIKVDSEELQLSTERRKTCKLEMLQIRYVFHVFEVRGHGFWSVEKAD